MADYITIISSVLSSMGLSAAAAGWLAKQLVHHRLEKDSKEHQAQLDQNLKDYQGKIDQNLKEYQAQLDQKVGFFFRRPDPASCQHLGAMQGFYS